MKTNLIPFMLGVMTGYKPLRWFVHLVYITAICAAYVGGCHYGWPQF